MRISKGVVDRSDRAGLESLLEGQVVNPQLWHVGSGVFGQVRDFSYSRQRPDDIAGHPNETSLIDMSQDYIWQTMVGDGKILE